MDITMQLLSAGDANSVFAGLHCMLAICRIYRFKSGDNREDFNRIVQVAFPQLLAIGGRLLEESSPEAWEMLRIILKTYKHAIYVHAYSSASPSVSLLISDSLKCPHVSLAKTKWLVGARCSSTLSERTPLPMRWTTISMNEREITGSSPKNGHTQTSTDYT